MMKHSRIIGTGSYLPEKILTNHDLEHMVETSDAWIMERTGIKKRHIAADNEVTSDLAAHAARKAIEAAGIQPAEIDLIIVATTTPDYTFPATAVQVQAKLGIRHGAAFDVQAVCAGFVYGLAVADSFIKSGQAKTVLVIGAETMSRIVDWTDRGTCVLFGDGAGAVVLRASEEEKRGILSSHLHTDGEYTSILKTSGGASLTRSVGTVLMEGPEVFKHATQKMASCVKEALEHNGLTLEDIDWLVPHQANIRILQSVAKKLKLSEEKVIITVHDHANTSAASIPMALDYGARAGKFSPHQLLVLEAIGGGLSWGSVLLRW